LNFSMSEIKMTLAAASVMIRMRIRISDNWGWALYGSKICGDSSFMADSD